MRHLPRLSDDYGVDTDDLSASAILAADIDELVDAIGDDWSLEDATEIDLPRILAH